ncbi:hypothetical protein AWB77_02017 [Caballeronia fortuita]|uniref:Uncharacterized protein n=1 Tax=Caballeronia fortuita TaxID=1777138 RepID=A0A158ASM1_9BURK|nr:hypothetical protein AWB77_02017 [Caballeronia fortuita]
MELITLRRWLYAMMKARAERLLPMDRRPKH